MGAKFSFYIHAMKWNVLRNICKCEMIHCISEKPSGPIMVNIWNNCSQRGKFSTFCMWKDNLFRDGWHVLCSQGSIITAVAALKYGPRDTRSRRWEILARGRSAGRWSSIFGEASPWWVFCSGWVGKGGLAGWQVCCGEELKASLDVHSKPTKVSALAVTQIGKVELNNK